MAPLAGGDNSNTFGLRLDDESSLVLKVYSELLASELAKEAFVCDLVASRELGLPTARILHTDDSRTILPRPFALMTKLEGELLSKRQRHLADDELVAVYREIGALLRRLHEVRLDAFGYLGAGAVVDPRPTNGDYMRAQFETRLRQFGELGGSERLQLRIGDHVAEREELFTGCAGPRLCHNDCHEANILIARVGDAWRITGVVDFGNAVAADPILDLAKTSLYSRWTSEERLDALAEGHGDLRDDWREAVRLYELYHRLELWWWFAFTGSRTDLLPRLEAAMASAVGV